MRISLPAVLIAAFLITQVSVFGQDLPKNDISIGFGAAFPAGAQYPLSNNVPDSTVAYGLHPWKFLQADVAFDTAFHPLTLGLSPDTGNYHAKDHLFATQFGARAVLPLGNRFTVAAGGGPAVIHYSTVENLTLGQMSFTRWGYYVLTSVEIALDRAAHFYIGSTPKFLHSNGIHYFVLGGEFGFRF